MTARIYAACLAAYNNGTLHGRWIDVTDPETMKEQIAAMLAESPEPGAEEWAVHDYDGIRGAIADSYGEYPSLKALCTYVAAREPLEASEAEAFDIWYSDQDRSYHTTAEQLTDAFHDAYIGEFNSREDFGEYIIGDQIDELLPQHLAPYFDTEAFARDCLLGDYWEQNGHYFRHC